MTWSEPARSLTGIIADDLTGANATGILVSRRGFRTASLTSLAWPEGGLEGYDCAVINTESRALPAAAAFDRVARAARLIVGNGGGRPVGKRIDSTLRGNLGPELEAVLEVLGPGSVAVVTGAFPASGRTTVAGNHYVHGVLLAETQVRHDPLCPVTESHVPTLLRGQTGLPVGLLPLTDVQGGGEAVAVALRRLAGAGVRLVCADAVTDADIDALGVGMARSELTCVAADPGPLTAAYAGALLPRGAADSPASSGAAPEHYSPADPRVLVVAGSVTSLSHQQFDLLAQEPDVRLLPVDAGALGAGPGPAEAEIARVLAALADLPPEVRVLGVRTGPTLGQTNHQTAETIAAGFAEIAFRAIQSLDGIAGLYTSGGDITLSVCRRLGVAALELRDEVMPLAVSARMLGGALPGLALVTKGGLVGGPDAALTCVRHLIREVSRNV